MAVRTLAARDRPDVSSSPRLAGWPGFARRHKINSGLLFVFPALAAYLLFVAWPTISIFDTSLYDWDGVSPTRVFVGLGNYVELLTDDRAFRLSIRNNLLWAVLVTSIPLTLGFLLAYALNLRLRLRNLYRTALFMPVVISSVVVGFTWGYIYSPKLGLLSNALQSVGLGSLDRAWLGDPTLAIYSVIAVAIWHQLGGAVVIYLAALQGIPQELFESAAMDGANAWQRMFHIAIPLTMYTTAVLVILNLIAAVKSFDLVYLLTRGGPYHASEVMAVGVYQQAFAVHHMGYASALSVVLLLIAALVTVVQLRLYGRSDSAS